MPAPSKHISKHEDFMLSVLGINLSKEEIWKCPVKQFGGNVHIINSPKDLEQKKIKHPNMSFSHKAQHALFDSTTRLLGLRDVGSWIVNYHMH